MKTLHTLPFALLMLVIGCASNEPQPPPTPVPDPSLAKTREVIRMSAQINTYDACRRKPELKPFFQSAVTNINMAIATRTYSAAALQQNLNTIHAEVGTNLAPAINLYSAYGEQKPGAPQLLEGLRDGVQLGLQRR